MRVSALAAVVPLAILLSWGGSSASAQDEAGYLGDSIFVGRFGCIGCMRSEVCFQLLGNGTLQQKYTGSPTVYMGTWSELPLVAGLTCRSPFVTFWRGEVNSYRITGIVMWGIMISRWEDLTTVNFLGRYIGLRSAACPP